MKVIFSKDCRKQIEAIDELRNNNECFEKLFRHISLCVKSLSEVKSIDDVPFGRRFHGINSELEQENLIEGRLKKIGEYDLSDLASRDLDRSNRLVCFSCKNAQAVIITSIGHYGLNSDREENYKNLDKAKTKINESREEYISELSNKSEPMVNSMLELTKDIKLSDKLITSYNNIAFNEDILPISFKTIEERLSSCFSVFKILDKYYNDHPKENRNFLEVINELKDISNIKSDKVKEIDGDIWKLFSDYVSYNRNVKDNIISKKIKITVDKFFPVIIPNMSKFQNTYIQNEYPVNSSIENRKNYFLAKVKSDTALVDNMCQFVKYCSKKICSVELKKSVSNYTLQIFNKNIKDTYETTISDNHIFIKSYNKNLLERINADIEKFNNLSKDKTKNIKKEESKNILPNTFSFFDACKVLDLNGAGLSRDAYNQFIQNNYGIEQLKDKHLEEEKKQTAKIKR